MKKLLILLFSLISVLASAQGKHRITGSVKDSKGEAVIGALIMLEGNTAVSCVSDMDGNYVLDIPSDKASKGRIEVSCLSYKTVKLDILARAVIAIVLEDNMEELDEVVVVGYGSMRRSDLTGSVTSVKIDETEAGHSASIDQLLQGRAAGVQVTSNSASPDGGVSVLIRGASSFNSSSEPLYVVDGIILNTSGSSSLMSSNLGGDNAGSDEQTNGLMGINPMDIASIEVLKDASATAIYGSQGANGVVLITTKSASREKPVITASIGVDISQRYKKMPVMNLDEYTAYLREVVSSPLVQTYNTEMINVAKSRLNVLRSDIFSDKYEEIDWQDYLMRTAVSQRYYVSIAGKPRNTNYMFSIGYNDTQGIVKTTGYQNLTLRLNLEHKFGKVTLGTRIGLSYLNSQLTQGASTGRLTAASSMMRSMLTCAPIIRLNQVDDDGDIVDFGDDENQQYSPNRWMNGFVNNKVEYRVNPSIYAQVKILKWLSFKTTFGADFRVSEQNKFKSRLLTSDASGSSAAISHMDRLAWNWDNVFMFNKRFNKKNAISGTVGMTMSRSNTVTQTTEGSNIDEWKALDKSINGAAYAFQTYTESSFSLMSFLLRGIYNYADRYVLTATVRADGSSRFAGKNKWGYFPSFAAAWRINQEPWFHVPVISTAKLRLGWGLVGNQAIASYATIYNYNTVYYPDHSNSNSSLAVGTVTSNLPNADLKWETTDQTNVGVDFAMFKGRLSLTLDLYYKLTRDLLQTKTLAPSAGMTNPYVNMGSIENKGLEITLDATPVATKDVEWSIGGNISFNRNKIVSINPNALERDWIYVKPGDRRFVSYFPGDDIGNGSVLKSFLNVFVEGMPMAMFYGMPTDGLVKPGETGLPYSESDTKYHGPGSVNYIDTNGDGYITEKDRVIIGDPNPDFTYGFKTAFRYRNFTFSATFVGSYGNDIYNVNKLLDTNTTSPMQNMRRDVLTKQWSEDNTDSWYPQIGALNAEDVKWASDRYVEDGSYLRLADLTLGYNIPIRKSFIKNISVSATGSNLVFWTRYSGWDPDVNSYGTVKKRGADMGSYPGARTYKIDLKFTF